MAGGKAMSKCAVVDGVAVHYAEAGVGEPVLLIHGLPTWSFLWRTVQPLLGDAHRTIAVDLVGFGRSDKPEYRDLGLNAQVDFLAKFMVQLDGGPMTVVGHDLGAAVAQLLAVRYPGLVSRLALVNPVDADTFGALKLDRFKPSELARRTTVEDLLRHLRETLPEQLGSRHKLSDVELEGYLLPWETPAGMGAYFQLARMLDAKPLADANAALKSIVVPVLVLSGDEDRLTPVEAGAKLAARFDGGAEHEVLARTGHLAPEETPGEVASHISRFIRRTNRYQ